MTTYLVKLSSEEWWGVVTEVLGSGDGGVGEDRGGGVLHTIT